MSAGRIMEPARMRLEWKAVESSRRGWYVSAARIAATEFRTERRFVIAKWSSAPGPESGLMRVENAINGRGKSWEALYERLYMAVGKPFAAVQYRKLSGKSAHPVERKASEPVDIWLKASREYVERTAGQKILRIMSRTLGKVRSDVAEGMVLGESMDDIAARIAAGYDGMTRNRSMVIARTEVVAASNHGGRAGAISTGLVLDHVWLATADDRTRETHDEADGQRIPIEEPYTVGDSQMMFPGDTSLGASAGETIQCRCAELFEPRGE